MATAKKLAAEVWAAVEAGEVERLDELFAESVEFSTTAGAGQGRDYVRQLFIRHRQGYPDLVHEVVDSIESADGDAVALRLTFRGTHGGELRGPLGRVAPTGRSLLWRSSDHVRVRDGKIVSWHAHFDRLTLLDQLGELDRLRRRAPVDA